MRNLIRSVILALGLLPGFAHAQSSSFPQTLPPNTVAGRLGVSAGPVQAIPFVAFFNNLPLPSGKVLIGSAGNLAAAQTISGDGTLSLAGVLTLATVNGNTGAFGSATQCVTVTNNAKGLTTAVSAATCTPAVGSITGLGTGVAAAAAINLGSAGSFITNGTAASGDLTGTYPGPTLASTITAGGPTGSATVAPIITYDAKGRLTAVSSATVTPAVGSITGLGTGVATALGVNVGTAGSPVLNGGALGTPSSGTLTNATGLPTTGLTGTLQAAQEPAHTGGVTNSAGSLALTVITNANLTGDVTSVGNATTLTNAPVIAKVLTGYSAGAGTVASTDSILQALQKLGGLVDNAAWATYTPTPTCNAGAGTWAVNTSKSKTIGKTVHWEIDVTLSAVGTCTGTAWKFNLPSTAVSGAGGAGGETAVNGTYVVCVNTAASAVETCTTGAALAVNERFVASGVYEGP